MRQGNDLLRYFETKKSARLGALFFVDSVSLSKLNSKTVVRAIDLELVRDLTPVTILRKEVIQPQVPLRLPCYDFTPVTDHSLGTYLPCGLAQPLLEQSTPMV